MKPAILSIPSGEGLSLSRFSAHPTDNIDVEEGVTVDVDERGHIVGLEVLDASKRLSPSDLTRITIEKLPLEITTP